MTTTHSNDLISVDISSLYLELKVKVLTEIPSIVFYVFSIEFDRDCEYFAIAGVTKKIKVRLFPNVCLKLN